MRLTPEAPAPAERLCARCGHIRTAEEASCPRCGAPPVSMRWAGGPARDNWFDAGLRLALGGAAWPTFAASAVLGAGLVVAGAVPAGLIVAAPAAFAGVKRRAVHGWVLDQAAVAFGRFWRWVTVDGAGRGAMVTLRGRRVAGFGGWIELVEPLAVDPPAPTAAEVVAAGPAAVARALEGKVPSPRPIDAAHVLVLAAFLHEVARGGLRAWRAERWRWVHESARSEVDVTTGSATPPILAWARGAAGRPADGTLEAALHAALAEQDLHRSAGALVGGRRLAGALGDPYRGSPIADAAPPPAAAVRLGVAAVGDWLVRHRAAPGTAAPTAIAERLALLAAAAPFLTAHILVEAENVRIAWFD